MVANDDKAVCVRVLARRGGVWKRVIEEFLTECNGRVLEVAGEILLDIIDQ